MSVAGEAPSPTPPVPSTAHLPQQDGAIHLAATAHSDAELLSMPRPMFELVTHSAGGREVPEADIASLLGRCSWAAHLDPTRLAKRLFGRCRVDEYKQGTELLRLGEPAPVIYILQSGELAIRTTPVGLEPQNHASAQLGDLMLLREGESCGELSLEGDRPLWYSLFTRSASVKILSIDMATLRSFLASEPLADARRALQAAAEADVALYSTAVQKQALQVQDGALHLDLFLPPMRRMIQHVLALGPFDSSDFRGVMPTAGANGAPRRAANVSVGGVGAGALLPGHNAHNGPEYRAPWTPIVVEDASKTEDIVGYFARPSHMNLALHEATTAVQWKHLQDARLHSITSLFLSSSVLPDPANAAGGGVRVALPAQSQDGDIRAPTAVRQPKQREQRPIPAELTAEAVEARNTMATDAARGAVLTNSAALAAMHDVKVHVKEGGLGTLLLAAQQQSALQAATQALRENMLRQQNYHLAPQDAVQPPPSAAACSPTALWANAAVAAAIANGTASSASVTAGGGTNAANHAAAAAAAAIAGRPGSATQARVGTPTGPSSNWDWSAAAADWEDGPRPAQLPASYSIVRGRSAAPTSARSHGGGAAGRSASFAMEGGAQSFTAGGSSPPGGSPQHSRVALTPLPAPWRATADDPSSSALPDGGTPGASFSTTMAAAAAVSRLAASRTVGGGPADASFSSRAAHLHWNDLPSPNGTSVPVSPMPAGHATAASSFTFGGVSSHPAASGGSSASMAAGTPHPLQPLVPFPLPAVAAVASSSSNSRIVRTSWVRDTLHDPSGITGSVMSDLVTNTIRKRVPDSLARLALPRMAASVEAGEASDAAIAAAANGHQTPDPSTPVGGGIAARRQQAGGGSAPARTAGRNNVLHHADPAQSHLPARPVTAAGGDGGTGSGISAARAAAPPPPRATRPPSAGTAASAAAASAAERRAGPMAEVAKEDLLFVTMAQPGRPAQDLGWNLTALARMEAIAAATWGTEQQPPLPPPSKPLGYAAATAMTLGSGSSSASTGGSGAAKTSQQRKREAEPERKRYGQGKSKPRARLWDSNVPPPAAPWNVPEFHSVKGFESGYFDELSGVVYYD